MNENIVSAKKLSDARDRIRNVRLKKPVAKLIISSTCFGNMEKQEIIDKVRELHKECGGKDTPEDKARGAVSSALRALVKEGKVARTFSGTYHYFSKEEEGKGSVYLFYYPTYKDRAEERGDEFWRCKIGKTTNSAKSRVGGQTTGSPEEPIIALEFKTDHPTELEAALHAILKLRGRHVENAGGKEWFMTNPDEVEQIHSFLTLLPSTSQTE